MNYSNVKLWIPRTSRFRKPWPSRVSYAETLPPSKSSCGGENVSRVRGAGLLTDDAKGAPDEPEAAGHALISGAASRRPQPGNGNQQTHKSRGKVSQ